MHGGRATAMVVWLSCWTVLGAMVLEVVVRGLPGTPFWIMAIPYTVAGALLATRVPRNPFGWLLFGSGLSWAASSMLRDGDLPFDTGGSPFALFYVTVALILLLFPDGRFRTPGARWIAWVFPAIAIAHTIGEVTGSMLTAVAVPVFVALMLVAASTPFVRYRRASGVERAQLRWPAYVIAAGVGSSFAAVASSGLSDWLSGVFGTVAALCGLVGLPTAMVIAVTKYRLYDIDRIVRRTVVYGVVVTILTAVFAVGAAWAPAALPTSNSLEVAATTLLVALAFQPLRRRVQTVVDRRFYRSRYEPRLVAESFAGQLRDEVDAVRITERWVDTVTATMRPETISVWVKQPPPTGPSWG